MMETDLSDLNGLNYNLVVDILQIEIRRNQNAKYLFF